MVILAALTTTVTQKLFAGTSTQLILPLTTKGASTNTHKMRALTLAGVPKLATPLMMLLSTVNSAKLAGLGTPTEELLLNVLTSQKLIQTWGLK